MPAINQLTPERRQRRRAMFVDDGNTEGSTDKRRQRGQTTPPDDGIAEKIHAVLGTGKRLTLVTRRTQENTKAAALF